MEIKTYASSCQSGNHDRDRRSYGCERSSSQEEKPVTYEQGYRFFSGTLEGSGRQNGPAPLAKRRAQHPGVLGPGMEPTSELLVASGLAEMQLQYLSEHHAKPGTAFLDRKSVV